jgi:hypothetical protein
MAHVHLWHHPIVFYQDFFTLLEWELSWGTKFMMRAFAEQVFGIPLIIQYKVTTS